MSADSPRKSYRSGGSTVRPQPVTDKTVIESVVDFFQDVVPAYSNTAQKTDDREKVHWVQFQQADINSMHTNPDYDAQSGGVPPLLLVIGYTNGIQIWAIPANGEAQEVMSVRQGPVRFLKVLPTPHAGDVTCKCVDCFIQYYIASGCHDLFASKRPLLAVCDASSAGQPYCSVKFLSLRTGDEVHNITFKLPVTDIQCNERVVVVAFTEKIAAFDALDLREKFCVTSCYPCPGPNPNPIALGTRWLAYADKKLVPVHQSCGGMTGDGRQSYAATVISAAKTITKGLTIFGETVASSLTGMKSFPSHTQKEAVDNEGCRPGVVTIIDIENAGKGQISVQDDCDGEGFIAHFPAHATEPVAAVKFDPSGTMLLTTDRLGHNFHLFRLMAHPWSCSLGAVHHLYTLHRGDTTAKVQDICFTLDSRWVAITTLHGTTHVFPITPYGGLVNVRTHTSQRVVNRASRFHRSAGLDDIDTRLTDRDSPVPLSGSPGSSPGQHPDQWRHLLHQNAINNSMGNPRLPPYPHPTTILPLVQIKQTLSIPGLGVPGARTGMGSKNKSSLVPSGGASECMCVAVCWAPSRGWVTGSPNVTREKSDKRAVDSLFVVSWTGSLIEYVLEPHMKNSMEKVTDDSQLEVMATPRAQWSLNRCISTSELRPPLSPNNAVILATDAVLTQRPSAELMGTLARQESRESLSSDHSSCRDDQDDQWLSQVEILTHSEPHRRLWMGPQFSFKTFQGSNTTTVLSSNSSVLLSHSPDTHLSAMDNDDLDLHSLKIAPSRSSPVAMPGGKRPHRLSSGSDVQCRSPVPEALLIETGSYEQSPSLMEAYVSWPETVPPMPGAEHADDRLREHLADAMIESPVKTSTHSTSHHDMEQGSSDNLSSSCGSGSSASRSHSFNAHPSPPRSIEHVLVFPTGNDSS